MIQVWIVCADVPPTLAINTGDDTSVCGACPLRGHVVDGRNSGRACYVQVRNAPYQVWKTYHAGKYPHYLPKLHAHLFRGRKLRLGAYGDPCAVPYRVWTPLVAMSTGHTAYSHAWQDKRFWRFRNLTMASVENSAQADVARSRGWRYFRAMHDVSDLGAGEILCPASKEGGKRRQCETCLACRGSNGNSSMVSVAIVAHGSPAVLSSYRMLASR
jgi:hypothetical protein